MKRLFFLFAIFLILSNTVFTVNNSYSLSDSEYQELKEKSIKYAEIEIELLKVWKQIYTPLDAINKKIILKDQQKWIRFTRDEEAIRLIDMGYSKEEAYCNIKLRRIEYLKSQSQKYYSEKIYTLSDEEYEEMKKSDYKYRNVDEELQKIWNENYTYLDKENKKILLEDQLSWIKVHRGKQVKQLIDLGKDKIEAYTEVTIQRCNYLKSWFLSHKNTIKDTITQDLKRLSEDYSLSKE